MDSVVPKIVALIKMAGLPDDGIIQKAILDRDTDALHELVKICCSQTHDAFVQEVHTTAQRYILKSGSLMDCANAVSAFSPQNKVSFQGEVRRLASTMILGDKPDYKRIESLMKESGKHEDMDAFINIVLRASAQQDGLKDLLNPGDIDVGVLTHDKLPNTFTVQSMRALLSIIAKVYPEEKKALEYLKREFASRDAIQRAALAEQQAEKYREMLEEQMRKTKEQEALIAAMMESIRRLEGNASLSHLGASTVSNYQDETTMDSPIIGSRPDTASLLFDAASSSAAISVAPSSATRPSGKRSGTNKGSQSSKKAKGTPASDPKNASDPKKNLDEEADTQIGD